jgi:hypothetical protein
MATGHPFPLPPCQAGHLGRSRLPIGCALIFCRNPLLSEFGGRQKANGRAMPGHSISGKNLEL